MIIKLYSKPDCQPCELAKNWLDERGISYQEIDVLTREGAAEFRTLKSPHIPLILTGHTDDEGKQIAFRHFDHNLFNTLWGNK